MADEKGATPTGKIEKPQATANEAKVPAAKSLPSTTKLSELTLDHLSAIIASEVRRGLGSIGTPAAGVHVNSGPPGFVNGGGHANFDPKTAGGIGNAGNPAGVHVNSGPPGFVNGGGHANFDPKTQFGGLMNVTLPDGGQLAIPATGSFNMKVRGFTVQR